MSSRLPKLYLARHGDTDWTDSHRKTGRTDLPLNERGEQRARQLGERLQQFSFAQVFTSPLQRANRTCALAGFGNVAEINPDLVEWDYGRFEGKSTAEIQHDRPSWELFRDGCPGGESPLDVAQRGPLHLAGVRRPWRCLGVFQRPHHSHDCGPLAGNAAGAGRFFYCRPASVGVLDFEHENKNEPIIDVWNFVCQMND